MSNIGTGLEWAFSEFEDFLPRAAPSGLGALPVSVTDDLISYWPMNESSNSTRVDRVGSNNLSNINNVAQIDGKIGKGADFLEPDELRKTSPVGLSFNGSSDFTFAVWVRFDTLTDPFHTIVSKGDAAGNNREYRIRTDTGTSQLFWEVDVDGVAGFDTVLLSTDAISIGTIHFVTWGYDSVAQELFLSIDDGVVDTLSHTSAINTSSTPFKVGNHDFSGDGFDGMIDELAVWSRKLTSVEISFLHNSGNGRNLLDFL